jgi:hypothetical protein
MRVMLQGTVLLGCIGLFARAASAQEPPPPSPPPTEPAPPPAESAPPAAPPPHAHPAEQTSPHEEAEKTEAEHANDLALKLTNPIADLVSIPFQFNWNQGVGPNDATQMVLNIQPVVPVHLTKDWNLIGRYIMPLTGQPSLGPNEPAEWGLGDIVFSLFLSPRAPSKFVWGIGPVFGLPGGTDPTINSGKWLLGPTGVALYINSPWTIGALVNQLWSVADTSDVDSPDVSQMFIQPFVSFTKDKWTLTAQTETTINWEANDGKWTVPIELVGARLTKLGFLPFSVQVGGGWFAASPDGGPDWRLRLNFVVLLPDPKVLKAGLMKK